MLGVSVSPTPAISEEEQPRFRFGKNWRSFLENLDDERISQAEKSLREMLGTDSLAGKRLLDIGSGSGLFSLAAHRLGAEVVSLDYDHDSVGCTEELKRRFANDQTSWQIIQGSVLDRPWIESLGAFDIVYSWGVLHHTGEMHRAIEIAADSTKPRGQFFLAIYNDQGGASRRWLRIKQTYHRLPGWVRPGLVIAVASWYEAKFALARLARFQNPSPLNDWRAKREDRGMSPWHDWVDWIGGLPFEVAKPEDIIVPLRRKGFVLNALKTVGNGWGCNEYVFERLPPNA
ncbi:bifunctional 3-demethylubiquinone-9 3-methyltransferase/ 2-octaprenyl-6-hydroxy phenol methylase [Novipirellula galeiformis]|uniref:Bifunctional 3-demethylubiquinone-9 3-methyltransferase/ 2-octaprenyl-6-hydroxy phenol methylase n=1 Tax=Novipirellula galeiformis TaxID=2528004 RepID=A0A5C6C967_9BACT|nr:class I SAM-dependent methyltransferase [Novipirellula galeiformis]TWU20625.1 bifunctional 3-demethylubiquinone-9 3-methyltransferase/ 2-octaprenyl-6-hydroxy phenol methylase [Novipirellula galeiformis]